MLAMAKCGAWGVLVLLGAMVVFVLLPVQRSLAAHPQTADTVFNQVDAKGQRHGFWRRFYRNGQAAYIAQFEHGKPVGITLRYDEQGRKEAEIRHRKGTDYATVIFYSDKGEVIARGLYYKQQKDSVWSYYGAGGRLVGKESWRKGKRDGARDFYSDAGVLAERQMWKDGKLHGRQTLYFENGKPRAFWDMAAGEPAGREGEWTFWTPSGKLESTTTYEKGVVVGGVERQGDSIMNLLLQNAGRIAEPATNAERPF